VAALLVVSAHAHAPVGRGARIVVRPDRRVDPVSTGVSAACYGKNLFTRKPSAVIGTSPGSLGTAIAQQHLRSLLGYCNSPQMNAPEAYIQFTPGLIADDGHVTAPSTEQFLQRT
jgi:hypothetical protein